MQRTLILILLPKLLRHRCVMFVLGWICLGRPAKAQATMC